jgi:uncharacterized protein (TIGR00369 family)
MDEWIVNDGPEDRCFGCGHSNPDGLRLRFRRTGPGAVEAPYTAPESVAGAPGVIHGGIQAAVLDEVLGMAASLDVDAPETSVVTVDFRIRYRRPAPTGRPLRARGRVLRVDGADVFVQGELVDESDEVLTRATARWRRVQR